MSMLLDDESIGVICLGCGTALTISNVSNVNDYSCYCKRCVMAIPPQPNRIAGESNRFCLSGMYPNFKWISAD